MSKRSRNRLRTVTVEKRDYKWRILSEKVGITLKIWNGERQLIIEEWFISEPKDGFNSAFLKKLINKEKR